MAVQTYKQSTKTVDGEWSLSNDSSGVSAKTDAGVYQVYIDLVNLTSTESYTLTLYEKVLSSGTQRIVEQYFFSGQQSEPVFVSPSFLLLNGWDFTLQKTAGTARSITFSVRSA